MQESDDRTKRENRSVEVGKVDGSIRDRIAACSYAINRTLDNIRSQTERNRELANIQSPTTINEARLKGAAFEVDALRRVFRKRRFSAGKNHSRARGVGSKRGVATQRFEKRA